MGVGEKRLAPQGVVVHLCCLQGPERGRVMSSFVVLTSQLMGSWGSGQCWPSCLGPPSHS